MKKLSKHVFLILKIAVVAAILFYLIHTEKLDLGTLDIYFEDPFLYLLNVLVWLLGCLVITSYRWQALLKGMNIHMPFKKVMSLNSIGFFFNTIAPGAVGGDFAKAYYLFRKRQSGSRTPALLAIFLDRLVGLYCVFLIAAVSFVFFYSSFLENKVLLSLALSGCLGFLVLTSLFFILFFFSKPIESNRVFQFLQKPYPGFRFLQKIFLSLFLLKDKPRYFLESVASGVAYQLMLMGFYAVVSSRMGNVFSFHTFAAIFPIGFILSALPIAPGGLGVGHLAFDQLFAIIGIVGGANIYNCVFIGQSTLNLLGFIPYLSIRKEKEKDKEAIKSQHLA